jgi:hypothetical protein
VAPCGPRPLPVREEPPQGCWVTFAPCGCVQHFAYLPAVTGLMERHPREAWITHWGPANPHQCQTSGRVTGARPCTDPACPHCAADRVAYHRRRREFPRADPSPDRPPVLRCGRPDMRLVNCRAWQKPRGSIPPGLSGCKRPVHAQRRFRHCDTACLLTPTSAAMSAHV